MKLKARYDRIFSLKNAVIYPGKDFLDMVFFVPPLEGRKTRLWMLTQADSPQVTIDEKRFKPLKATGGKYRWVDLGITEVHLGGDSGFGQIKFFGISHDEAKDSYFVVTTQIEKEFSGSIEEIEEQLWGISRRDAGRTFINPSTLEVGKPAVFKLIYEASERGLPKDSYIRFCIPRAFTSSNLKAEDVRIEVIGCDSPFEFLSAGISNESPIHVDVIYRLPEGMSPSGKMIVNYQTEFTYLFESIFNQMERRYWYSKLPLLATAVAVDKRAIFISPLEENGHTIRFVAGEPERLHLFLPGRRRKGEEIKLIGIITDKYRNLVRNNLCVKFKLKIEGIAEKEIGDATGYFTARHKFVIPLPDLKAGLYRIKAIDEDTKKLIAVSNPLEIVEDGSEKPNIYWGEIHGHSEMSDGIGGFEGIFEYAGNVAAVDFAAAADHAEYFTDNQSEWMQDVVNSFNEPGKFCTLVGYEWAGKQGHRNIYTSDKRLKLFRGMYGQTSNIGVVWKEFEGRDDIVGGSHTKHTGKFWEQHNPEVMRFLEIYGMTGSYDEIANKLLSEGAKLGFTGGGDCHEGRSCFSAEDKEGQGRINHAVNGQGFYKCGISGALMDKLDRKSLINALRNRKTYATTGARILIDFSVSDIPMGSEGTISKAIIQAEIHACEKIGKVEIVRDGKVVHVGSGKASDMKFEWEDKSVVRQECWYYLKVLQGDGEIAWTSPIWIKIKKA
ncbi:CehA/McbA family metallohydrolase [bacterium]|nr:CehA/McbA family metallohydrolase [bacterium]